MDDGKWSFIRERRSAPQTDLTLCDSRGRCTHWISASEVCIRKDQTVSGPITGLRERSARDLLATLVADGILGPDTPKGPITLRFPLHEIELSLPNLFAQA
jgi:hypothetical protein